MRRFPTCQHLEDALHTHIWKSLDLLLPSDCLAWSVENRNCGPKEGKRRTARGCIAGIPDLHILYRGRLLLIELKAPRGVVSAEQKGFLTNARICGAATAICRSLDEVVDFLKKHGVRLRGTVQ